MDFRTSRRNRKLELESLESRVVLTANTFGEITANVIFDANENGIVDTGEQLENASLELFLDVNGNGQIDANDDLIATGTTGPAGSNTFSGLGPGNYVVVQPEQTVGGIVLASRTSSVVLINQGFVENTSVDNFSGSNSVETEAPGNLTADNVFALSLIHI